MLEVDAVEYGVEGSDGSKKPPDSVVMLGKHWRAL